MPCTECNDKSIKSRKGHTTHKSKGTTIVAQKSTGCVNPNPYLDDFLRQFAIDDEYNPQTGLKKKHAIPSAYIDWNLADTIETPLEGCCNLTWQYRNNELLIRDKDIYGDENSDSKVGGQIVIRRRAKVPISAIEGGYPAASLKGLNDTIASYFDNMTIVRDVATGKFTAKLISEEKPKLYSNEEKSQEVFILSKDGSYYYLNPQSLDYLIKVKSDGVTIGGDGKTLPLQAIGGLNNGNTPTSYPTFTKQDTQALKTDNGTFKPLADGFDLNVRSWNGTYTMNIALPSSPTGKWRVFLKNSFKIDFDDNAVGWDQQNKFIKYSIEINTDKGGLSEPGTTIVSNVKKQRTIAGTNITSIDTEIDDVSGIWDISDQVKTITIRFTVTAPKTSVNPNIQISENLINLTILSNATI